MDEAALGRLYNQCDPSIPLGPDDDRNVNIDAEEVRGKVWAAQLFKRIRLSASPVCELFTGLPGSGKSTELRRLERTLESSGFLPVLIDAEQEIDINGTVDVADVLATIVYRVERAVLIFEEKDPDKALQESFSARLWNWLDNTDVSLRGADLKIAEPAKLNIELKTRPSLRQRFREIVGAHLPRFLNEVHDELKKLQARVTPTRRNGIVVIFDSLEKLRGTYTTHPDIQASAERLFVTGRPYLDLPVHVIYTVPTYLISLAPLSVQFMPMIKLYERDGERRFEPGFRVAREIIRKRIPDTAMPEILGAGFEKQLDLIIEKSGGYPRELIRVLRNILLLDRLPASNTDVQRVLNEARDQMSLAILTGDYPWLAQVALKRELVTKDEKDRQSADRMLTNNIILRYQNDSMWFDVHPLVREVPGVKDEIERLKSTGSSSPPNPEN